MRDPNIISIENVLRTADECHARITERLPDGRYVRRWAPARPLGFSGICYRFRAAWMVFTGRADALMWPGQ